MECLRLRTIDTELIKNRLAFLRGRMSASNPIGPLLSARRENNNGERETNGACGAKPQQQKKHSGVVYFLRSRGRRRGMMVFFMHVNYGGNVLV